MPLLIRWSGIVLLLLSFPRVLAAQTQAATTRATASEGTDLQGHAPTSAATPPTGSTAASQSHSASGKPANGSQQPKSQKKLPRAPRPNPSPSGTSQTKRMLWVVPNFAAVSPGVQFHPLTSAQKFWMATEDSFDYSSFVWTGVLAAQSYGLDQYPELGQGGTAYAGYYWRGLLDGVSNSYLSEAIVPVITHEDPRYFTMGHGGLFRRMGYALSRVVITKSDAGGDTFNISEVGGDLASAALSTAYYPRQERGMVKVSEGWGTQLESAALNNIAKEFWPDIRKDLFHQH